MMSMFAFICPYQLLTFKKKSDIFFPSWSLWPICPCDICPYQQFWTKICFGRTQYFLDPTIFESKFLGLKFWTRILFDLEFFLTGFYFDLVFFVLKSFCPKNFLDPKFFCTYNFSNLNYLNKQNFLTQLFLSQIFLDQN